MIPTISGNIKSVLEPVIINVSQAGDITEINYEINEFEDESVFIKGIEYSIINIGEESNLLLEGKPDIPSICRSIIIPDTAKMKIEIKSSSFVEFDDILIAPSKGNLLRSVNPDDVPYTFNEVYSEDKWFPDNVASLRDPYIVRDYRGIVVDIYPIQYNPIKKTMRFYTDIKVEVYPDGIGTINIINRENLPEKIDSDFKGIYNNQFLNFGLQGRYDPIGEEGNLIIICYDDFMDEMQPFVEWKKMKGLPTEIIGVSTIGGANEIKAYIQNYYDGPGLTYVLLVGDVAQIPTLTAGYSASDPSYSYVAGSDHYPDLFIGRFSAQNSDQLNTQVERSIEYEKYPQAGAEWYQKGVGIASSQGPGDDGEMDYEHIRNIRNNKLFPIGYTIVDELYDGSQGGDDAPGNPTPTMVSTAVNDGRSIINYCGHGSPSSWGSSGFSTSHINTLVNDNMLPYVTCVACNNGEFDNYDACFCEAWLRATNNGEPAGAIVATGSSKGMSWNPPMDGQDEMMDLFVGTYTDNIKRTFGGIHANGCMHMNDEYGSSGESETDTWHVFGDPSLVVRNAQPETMTVIHDTEIDAGETNFDITVAGVENALCAISRNGDILGYAYTNSAGQATISFDPISGENPPLDLVITGYNKIPYITQITIIVNYAPETPDKPDGPREVKVGEEIVYTTISTDAEGEDIYYMWDWGDETPAVWEGPFSSGVTVTGTHTWTEEGYYFITVKAKDVNDRESDWSDHFLITVSTSRDRTKSFTLIIFEKILNLLPLLEQFIKLL
jgi:hypothetical protein